MMQKQGRTARISVALPSSILANAQSEELRIYLAGQIARTVAIYGIDEIVIFNENPDNVDQEFNNHGKRKRGGGVDPNPTSFFRLVLEYLETPQYLRKHLFPVSPELRLVGLLNPLGLPSHVARKEISRYREGIAVGRTNFRPKGRNHQRDGVPYEDTFPPTKFVDVGLEKLVEIDKQVSIGKRVTVDMTPSGENYTDCPGKYLFGQAVDRNTPRISHGMYWGYTVRTATCLSNIFHDENDIPIGYDLVIGTSERGTPLFGDDDTLKVSLPKFKNLLLVFGGVQGLEKSVEGDTKLEKLGIRPERTNTHEENSRNVADLFDYYVNTCPHQGTRTIRTEEAILLSLAALQPFLHPYD